LLCIPIFFLGQESDRGSALLQSYQQGIFLYQNKFYQGAQVIFERISDQSNHYITRANSSYYSANAAVRLNQIGADRLMTRFVDNYPVSVFQNSAYLDVADFYFDQGKYPNAVTWYRKANGSGLFGKNRERFDFRMGYGLFATDRPEAAKQYLQRVSNSREYGSQAKYYLGYSAYQQNDYQQATRQFDQITDQVLLQEKLGYFQADMNFKLGNFQEAIDQATRQLSKSDTQETSELNKIIGESYFNLKQYDRAIPYLEGYSGKEGRWTNTDFYLLGYAYYQQHSYIKAIAQFNKIIGGNDFVAQNAYYHLGICYLNSDKKQEALHAFRNAGSMIFDAAIQQDALYSYSLLSYEIGNAYESVPQVLKGYLDRYPGDSRSSEIQNLLVNSYLTSRNFEAALELAQANRNSIEDKTYQKIAYYRGIELFLSKRYSDAAQLFQLAAGLRGVGQISALALYWNAECDYEMGRYAQALNGFEQFRRDSESLRLAELELIDYNIGYANFNLKHFSDAIHSFASFCSKTSVDASKRADALLRLGDSYFATSQYREAVLAYDQALQSGSAQKDYADFQKAIGLGFLGQGSNKLEILAAFNKRYPNSPLADDALFELGNTYLDQGNEPLALREYDRLISSYPNSPRVVSASMRKGLTFFNRGQNREALEVFQEIAERYPEYPEAAQAIQSAKLVAIELGEVAAFANWASQFNFTTITENELEAALFEAANRQLESGNTKGAQKSYESYLEQYPSGANHIKVRFALAQLFLSTQDIDKALPLFKQVAAADAGSTGEEALTRIGDLLMSRQDFAGALPYLKRLDASANILQNRVFAKSNLMRGYFERQELDQALPYAQSLLEFKDLDLRIRSDARLVLARAAFQSGNFQKAQTAYATLLKESIGEATAEALYYEAFFTKKANDPEASNLVIQRLLRDHSAYREWGGKGLLLMAQNFKTLDDSFQATYILENVIVNFEEYPELVALAREELQAIKLQESARNADVDPEGKY
jgi:TolA-binding protein